MDFTNALGKCSTMNSAVLIDWIPARLPVPVARALAVDGGRLGHVVRVPAAAVLVVGEVDVGVVDLAAAALRRPVVLALHVRVAVGAVAQRVAEAVAGQLGLLQDVLLQRGHLARVVLGVVQRPLLGKRESKWVANRRVYRQASRILVSLKNLDEKGERKS